ncbi:MAG TPA: hypothetical protein VIT19_04030 [Pyrinomonadaceae bacterium]
MFYGQASIARNTAHSEGVNRVVPGNRYEANTVRHNDVFALAEDAKASLLESAHSIEVIDAGNLRHVRPPPSPHGRLAL